MASVAEVQDSVAFLNSACVGIRHARKRLGGHSPETLWAEVSAINKGIAATQNGFLLLQKLAWFDQDALIHEAESVKAVFAHTAELLEHPEVREVLHAEGRDADALFRRARLGVMRCERFKELVREHAVIVEHVRQGGALDVHELDRVEKLLTLDLGALAEKTLAATAHVVKRVRNNSWFKRLERQPRASRAAMLAALALGSVAGLEAKRA